MLNKKFVLYAKWFYHCIYIICNVSKAMATAKEITLQMFDNIQKGTEFILGAIPMDKLDHSVDGKSATIGDLAFHIATLPLGSVLITQGKFDKFPPIDELMKAMEPYLGDSLENKDYKSIFTKSCKAFIEFYESKSADEWINSTYENFLTRGPRTYLQGFYSMQNHLLQHRGSLTSTLRSAGIHVSLKQYWGMMPYTS